MVIADKIFGVVGVVLVQYAIAIGSVTIVNGLAGVQFALVFALVWFLTKIKPKLFKEYFTSKEICIQILAVLAIIIGSIFLR